MRIGLGEIFYRVSKASSENEQIEILRKNFSDGLKTILQYALDPNIKWLLPTGAPPYKPCTFLDQESLLYQNTRKLYLFVEGGNPSLKKTKRESIYIGLLESVAPKDAELLVAIKDKQLPYGVKKDLIFKSFPGMFNYVVSVQTQIPSTLNNSQVKLRVDGQPRQKPGPKPKIKQA
jgi:hypothetical protein